MSHEPKSTTTIKQQQQKQQQQQHVQWWRLLHALKVLKKKETRDLKRQYIYFALFWLELAMRFRFIVLIFVTALFVGVISQTVFLKNDQNEKFGWFWLTGGGWRAMVSKKGISEPTRPDFGFFNSKHSDVKLILQSFAHKVNGFMSRVFWYVVCQEEVT